MLSKDYIKKLPSVPYPPLAELSRQVAAEGCVLLKNDDDLLPLKKTDVVSLFGRSQIDYIKSGTGSGGLVRVKYAINILDGIKENTSIQLNNDLVEIYKNWIKENPFDKGSGWAQEPWCQVEMVPDEKTLIDASSKSDIAILIIGRTAGEDRDNSAEKGSWYLTDNEDALLSIVSKHFEKTVVLLNTGNIIDMSWVDKYNIKSVMYIWQGGQEGGRAVADILSGKVNPCGKLTDTIAKDISLYPSTKNFGNKEYNLYEEDIYVGYRYFETFAKDDVLYPFGHGLSYTKFSHHLKSITPTEDGVEIEIVVENTGNFAGKEVVQCYFESPQGNLGKCARQLCGFAKTGLISPGEKETVNISLPFADMASYDDIGITGNKSCYVLENGEYNIFIGNNVRTDMKVFTYIVKTTKVVKKCKEILSPIRDFNIFHPIVVDGKFVLTTKPVSKRTTDYDSVVRTTSPKEIKYTGDRGIKLIDVKNKKYTINEFVAQLSDEDLMCIARGEGMCSSKVRPGSAGAIGGTTESLCRFGVPIIALHDGPSGIRIDSGECATSLPNGTAIACTWNVELAEKLYENLSVEMCTYNVDCILGPGINIHRSPLNGRNFEYMSEDPYLTGIMAAALVRGVAKYGNSATIKHFAANSQEYNRKNVDSVMSERAAREIYLKSFEYVVRFGKPTSIMTSYNPINGIWSANNYELNTAILRNEWGYDGFVVTDWWPKLSEEESNVTNLKSMVTAQNDVYMPTPDALTFKDNLVDSLKNGEITSGHLQRNAINILKHLCNSNALERFIENGCKLKSSLFDCIDSLEEFTSVIEPDSDKNYTINLPKSGTHLVCIEYSSDEPDITQLNIMMKTDGRYVASMTLNGTDGKTKTVYKDIPFDSLSVNLSISYPQELIKLSKIEIKGL